VIAYNELMTANAQKQYTIRNIPANVDRALRKRMKDEGKSLNEVAIEALAIGSNERIRPFQDLSYLIGSMSDKEAELLEAEIDVQKTIDPDLWK
jgi:hypothetical protein